LAETVDLFDNTYRHFTEPVLDQVRKETFGVDIGQNSWVTADEYERFVSRLGITAGEHVLEVASGSGGPALHLARLTGCVVTGIDANASGVATAAQMAALSGQARQVRFAIADATAPLPFRPNSFDGLLTIDSMNHFPDRRAILSEWRRVLRTGRRAVFTDPVVITGPVTNAELALRSSVGLFVFVPPAVTEQFIEEAGFRLVEQIDVSENAALIAGRWYQARQNHRDDLVRIEGEERFAGLQRFFAAVHRLTAEKRLSRVAYVVEKD
jgi:SAM-dependent methyltransferase